MLHVDPLIVPTFASIIILSKKAFKDVVKSLFAENKEPLIIFNKNVAITRERPELKKKQYQYQYDYSNQKKSYRGR